jgi:Spy/CpxP family protein refolding chaperone
MSKTKVALIVAFVAIFAAGAVVGRVAVGPRTDAPNVPGHRPPPHGGDKGERGGRSWIGEALGLSDEKADQIKEIWQTTMSAAGDRYRERRQAIDKEFDESLRALMTDEGRQQYDALLARQQQQREELNKERGEAFDEAVEKTIAVLTPEQAAKYREIMEKRRNFGPRDRDRDRDGRDGRGGPNGRRGPGGDRGPRGDNLPSTRPFGTTQPD